MNQSVLSAKKRVEKEVLDTIIDGLNSGEIDSQKAQEIAKETLATLKMLDEHEESIEIFYKNLSDKHPIFKSVYTRVRAEIVKARELSAHRKALLAIIAGATGGVDMAESHVIAGVTAAGGAGACAFGVTRPRRWG